jgi:membrane protein CcdC involved in cytochrome C biogenesis
MQAVIVPGFVVMAVGAILFVVPRVLPFRGRTARSLTRLAVAAWLLAILLIVTTVAIGLIGHALLFA